MPTPRCHCRRRRLSLVLLTVATDVADAGYTSRHRNDPDAHLWHKFNWDAARAAEPELGLSQGLWAANRSGVVTTAPDVQDWWARLISADDRNCPHTHNFFHYFLPHVQCDDKRLMGQCGDGAKWLCGVPSLGPGRGSDASLPPAPPPSPPRGMQQAPLQQRPCVVYSFGSHGNTCFEQSMFEGTRCEIHVFDPTIQPVRSRKWRFQPWGLGGDDKNDTRYWHWKGEVIGAVLTPCRGCPMKTLSETMEALGHSFIDVLKVDVDGAEWRAMESAFRAFGSQGLPVGQLQIETSGGDMTPVASARIARLFLELGRQGFAAFHLESNILTCWMDKRHAPDTEYSFVNVSHWRRELRGGSPPAAEVTHSSSSSGSSSSSSSSSSSTSSTTTTNNNDGEGVLRHTGHGKGASGRRGEEVSIATPPVRGSRMDDALASIAASASSIGPAASECNCAVCTLSPPSAPLFVTNARKDGAGAGIQHVLYAMAFAARQGWNFGGAYFKSQSQYYHHAMMGRQPTSFFTNSRYAVPRVIPTRHATETMRNEPVVMPFNAGHWSQMNDTTAPLPQALRVAQENGSLVTLQWRDKDSWTEVPLESLAGQPCGWKDWLPGCTTHNGTLLDEFLTPSFLSALAHDHACSMAKLKYTPKYFGAGKRTVAMHVRRGDVSSKDNQWRFTPNEYYLRAIAIVRRHWPDAEVHVFSAIENNTLMPFRRHREIREDDVSVLAHAGAHVHLDSEQPFVDWVHFVYADVFIMAKSSFSTAAAIVKSALPERSRGCTVYQPYWVGKLSTWTTLDVLNETLPACAAA